MAAAAELLNAAKQRAGIPSDNALSQRLGVTRAMVSSWRSQLKPMPDERIAQLCALAKLDGPEWMARIHAERAESPAERQLWQTALQRLTAVAAALAVVVIAHRLSGPDGAISALMLPAVIDPLCIMRKCEGAAARLIRDLWTWIASCLPRLRPLKDTEIEA